MRFSDTEHEALRRIAGDGYRMVITDAVEGAIIESYCLHCDERLTRTVLGAHDSGAGSGARDRAIADVHQESCLAREDAVLTRRVLEKSGATFFEEDGHTYMIPPLGPANAAIHLRWCECGWHKAREDAK